MSAVTPRRTTAAERLRARHGARLEPRQDAPQGAPEGPPGPSPPAAHRRRLLALAALGLALALASAAWLALSGSGSSPPATGADRLVPADALAYVHLSTDPSRPAVASARRTAARFPDWPLLENAALDRLGAIVGGTSSSDLAAAVRPWLGKEAAVALLASGANGAAQPLVVLDVTRRARAQAFLTAAGASPAGAYDGARVLAYPSGTELAFVGHYLVAGSDVAIRAALDAARGRAASLAHDPAYARAAAGEPADRVLDAYLPVAGIRRLLEPRTGVAGAIGVLLDRPALRGTTISLSAAPVGARLLVHSVMSPGASAPSTFTPTLQSVMPAGATMMLDVPGLDRAAPGLLQAAATAGIAGNVGPLLRRLGASLAAQGVNVHAVTSLFAGETAVAISPGPAPALLVVARVRDEAAARSELAALEAPLTALFSPAGSSAVQVPELADHQVAGATVHELQLGPGVQLDFGVFKGLVAISTSVAAIDGVAQRSRAVADEAAYRATLSDRPDRLSSLVFGDFSRLLAFGEQTGLTSGAQTRELLPDLSRVRAIGLSSTSGERDTTTEITLEIP